MTRPPLDWILVALAVFLLVVAPLCAWWERRQDERDRRLWDEMWRL